MVRANGSGVPSEVISRYLEAIYYMRAEGETVTNARLAEWLSVSRPTVTAGLRRMARDGLLRHDSGRRSSSPTRARPRRRGSYAATGSSSAGSPTAWASTGWRPSEEPRGSERDLRWSRSGSGRARAARLLPAWQPHPGLLGRRCRARSAVPGGRRRRHRHRISEVAEREAPSLLHYLHERNLVPGTSSRSAAGTRWQPHPPRSRRPRRSVLGLDTAGQEGVGTGPRITGRRARPAPASGRPTARSPGWRWATGERAGWVPPPPGGPRQRAPDPALGRPHLARERRGWPSPPPAGGRRVRFAGSGRRPALHLGRPRGRGSSFAPEFHPAS